MASPWTTGSLGSLAPFPVTAPSAPQGTAVPPAPEPWPRQLSQQPPLNSYGYQLRPGQTFLSTPQPAAFDESAQPQAPVANPQAQQHLPDPSGWPGPSEYAEPPTAIPEILPTADDLFSALGTIPRFLYISLLLFLPFFYRARVNQVFHGVSLAEREIASRYIGGRPRYWDQVKRSWSDFIETSIKEWNTLNIVSVLLLGAIYNVLQLGGAGSQLVQCTALMSLISALMSLIFGCLYVIRFETLRRPHNAMEWAPVTLSTRNPWWNVLILLALPFVWLAWSLILFLICLMATIWQTSGNTTPLRGLSHLSLPVKVIVSVIFSIGVFYLFLILNTFAHYDDIDEAWHKRIKEHIKAPAATNRLYDQTYAWGANPYAGVPDQPPGAPGLSYASYPTVGPPLQIPVVPPPFLGPQYQQPYLQSPGGQLPQPQYTSRSVTPVSISHVTPFIPDRPLSPAASYRAPPYDRYLSPRLSTHSPQSLNRNLYSIAEGEGQEPSSPSFHRGRGPPVPSQPQRQFSNTTRSSSDSHDISHRSRGIRLMPMAFPPDNTTITIEPPQPPSSDSADNLDILERDEMPRQHQHHGWTDQGQPDELQPPSSSSTLLPPTRLTTSLSPPPTYNDIPSSLGFVAGGGGSLSPGTLLDPSPGGSRRSSRRPTPSPHRTDRHDPRTTQSQSQDRNYRSSDRLRPPDLPPPSAAPDIMTRSVSLPVALERHATAAYELGGGGLSTAPTSATATAATATATTAATPTTATAATKEQAQPADSAPATDPLQSSRPTPLISPIPLPPHVSPPPPDSPDLPNLGPSLFIDVVDADADPGGYPNSNANTNPNANTNANTNANPNPNSNPNTNANSNLNSNPNSNTNAKSNASANTNPYGEDDIESRSTVSSLELYSITPSGMRGGGGNGGGGGGGSGSGSEGVSLHTARGQFDSGSGSSDEE